MDDAMSALAPGRPAPIPAAAGVGLKAAHYRDVLEEHPAGLWFEVHPENYMGAGGAPHYHLARIRERHPLSLHGVGLSIGGEEPLDSDHLARLAALVNRYRPGLVSEHLAWSRHDGRFLNDLLPVAYDDDSLASVVDHVSEMQDRLGRQVLVENPSTYLRFTRSHHDEVDFLAMMAARTGCGLLLDINNVHVSSVNHGFDAVDYVQRFPMRLVGEIHVAGHDEQTGAHGEPLLIDTHDRPVAAPVLGLLARALELAGPKPVLLERDARVPDWQTLRAEVAAIQTALDTHHGGRRRDELRHRAG